LVETFGEYASEEELGMGKKLIFIVIITCSLLMLALYLQVQEPSTLVIYALGTSDAYGNRIIGLVVFQWNGTSDMLVENKAIVCNGSNIFDGEPIVGGGVTPVEYSYPSGFSYRVKENASIIFNVYVALNKTLVPDEASAKNYTRAFISISGIVTNYPMIYAATHSTANFYIVGYRCRWGDVYSGEFKIIKGDIEGYPQLGTTYNVEITYEAYY